MYLCLLKSSIILEIFLDITNGSASFKWYSDLNEYIPAGHYVCKAKRHKTGTVEEKYLLVIKRQLVKRVAYVGQPFEFNGTLSNASPNKIQWYKDGIEINDGALALTKLTGIMLENRTFYIPSIKVENRGKYECIVKDNSIEVYIELLLDVNGQGNISSNLLF